MTKRKQATPAQEAHLFIHIGLGISQDRMGHAMKLVGQLQGMREFPDDDEGYVDGLEDALLDALYCLLNSTKDSLESCLKAHVSGEMP
jgi:hypothetical protein